MQIAFSGQSAWQKKSQTKTKQNREVVGGGEILLVLEMTAAMSEALVLKWNGFFSPVLCLPYTGG